MPVRCVLSFLCKIIVFLNNGIFKFILLPDYYYMLKGRDMANLFKYVRTVLYKLMLHNKQFWIWTRYINCTHDTIKQLNIYYAKICVKGEEKKTLSVNWNSRNVLRDWRGFYGNGLGVHQMIVRAGSHPNVVLRVRFKYLRLPTAIWIHLMFNLFWPGCMSSAFQMQMYSNNT